jgi:hypothetical protein
VVERALPAWRVDDDDVVRPEDGGELLPGFEDAGRYIAIDFRDGTGPPVPTPDQVTANDDDDDDDDDDDGQTPGSERFRLIL